MSSGNVASTFEHWSDLIEQELIGSVRAFCNQRGELVSSAFLTGSYSRGTYNPRRPNVNIYFVSQPDCAAGLRLELGLLWHRIRGQTRAKGVDFLVDCHPYTVSHRDATWRGRPLLSLTTKVLDGAKHSNRYDLAPTIGLGWVLSHSILYGDPDPLGILAKPTTRDREWIQAVYEALTHYRSVLDHLPWALAWAEWPGLLLEESFRYAEETIRDGIAVVLTPEELREGLLFQIYHHWDERAHDFFRVRYGEEGIWAVDAVRGMKELVQTTPDCGAETAQRAWHDALTVWHIVWCRYRSMVEETLDSVEPFLLRVNAFV